MRRQMALRLTGLVVWACAVALLSPLAGAQSIVVALDPDTDLTSGDFTNVNFENEAIFVVADTLAEAFTEVRDRGIQELWIVRRDGGAAWSEVFPALGGVDDDAINVLDIRGFPFDTPWAVVIAGGVDEPTIPIIATEETDLLIEGLTVRGGNPGIRISTIDGEADEDTRDAMSVTINRCIVRNAAGDGIEISGFASARIFNASISENDGDGVYAGPDAAAEIEFCSIIRNSGAGVFADGSADRDTAAIASGVTLEGDAYIDSEFPEDTFGTDSELRVRARNPLAVASTGRSEAVLTFESPNLPDIQAVLRATLRLQDTVDEEETPDNGVTRVFSTVLPAVDLPCAPCLTWDNAPTVASLLDEQRYETPGAQYEFDVTPAFLDACTLDACTLDERLTLRVSHWEDADTDTAGLIPEYASSDFAEADARPVIELEYRDEFGDTQILVLAVDTAVPGAGDTPVACACDPDPDAAFPGDTVIDRQDPLNPTGAEADPVFVLRRATTTEVVEDLGKRDALLQFEIENLPPGKPVSAELRLTAQAFPSGAKVTVYGALNPNRPRDAEAWSEADVTWNDPNAPKSVARLDDFEFTSTVDPTDPIEVVFDVSDWIGGNGLVDFRIESDSDEEAQFFASAESGIPPTLIIEWEEELSPFDADEEPRVLVNNALIWLNGGKAFFEAVAGAIQQGSAPWFEDEPDDAFTMHVDQLGSIFDRRPAATASNPRVRLSGGDFAGRILSGESPLIGAGTEPPSGFTLDLDFDLRSADAADIGADEFVSAVGAGLVTWFFSTVTPPADCFGNQGAPGDPIGEVAAGEVRVEVRVRSNEGGEAVPDAVFLLPQDHMRFLINGPLRPVFNNGTLTEVIAIGDDGVDVSIEVIRIQPEVVAGFTWFGTNADPISTRLFVGPDSAAGGFSASDTFADGHAIVCLAYAESEEGPFIVGDEPGIVGSLDTLDENGSIIDQALIGRHVLIDTIAPRFNIGDLGPNPTAANFLADSNDILIATTLPAETHPFPPPRGLIAATAVPVDGGAVVDTTVVPPRAGPGGSIFLNRASLSNRGQAEPTAGGGIPGTFSTLNADLNALRVQVVADFSDLTLEEFLGIEYAPGEEPIDLFTGDAIRPIAGFRPTASFPLNEEFQTTVGELLSTSPEELSPLFWGYAEGSRRFDPDATVFVQYGITDRDAGGAVFDFAAIRDGALNTTSVHPNAAITGDWHFRQPPPSVGQGSLRFEDHIEASHFVARLLFRGRDAACNVTPIASRDRRQGPLNLWWIVNVDTRLTRHTDGDELELGEASFSWELARGFSPSAIGQPQPQFTWRVYQLDTTAPVPEVYIPATDWAPWRPGRSGPDITPEEFEDLVGIFGEKLLLVVIGADEAGNVTKFPFEDLVQENPGDVNSRIEVVAGRRERPNWFRFTVTREQTARARIAADLWWSPFDVRGDIVSSPVGAANTFGSVVPLPPLGRTIPPRPGDNPPLRFSGEQVSARFRIDLTGLDDRNVFNPSAGDELIVLFDLRLVGADDVALVRNSEGAFGYGAGFPIDPTLRSLTLTLPSRVPPPNFLSQSRVAVNVPAPDTELIAPPFTGAASPFAFRYIAPNGDILALTAPVLGDQTRGRAVEYVARASLWIRRASGTVGDRDVQSAPANYRFVVVPDTSRAEYFRPRFSPDDQPIRVREEN